MQLNHLWGQKIELSGEVIYLKLPNAIHILRLYVLAWLLSLATNILRAEVTLNDHVVLNKES